jgi:hypothetical protein
VFKVLAERDVVVHQEPKGSPRRRPNVVHGKPAKARGTESRRQKPKMEQTQKHNGDGTKLTAKSTTVRLERLSHDMLTFMHRRRKAPCRAARPRLRCRLAI